MIRIGLVMKRTIILWASIIMLTIPLLLIVASNLTPQDNSNTDHSYSMTIGFYMCGEGFSDSILDNDISDTIGLNSNQIKIIYLVDYDGFGNTELFTSSNYSRIYINISEIMPYDSSELDLGSKEVLNSFVEYVLSYDSQYYCLELWGHGKGYEGVCFDHGSSLSTSDINYALSDNRMDLLIFDACEMISLEVLYDIKDCSDYLLGSEKDIPDRGLDYAGGLDNYIKTGHRGPVALAHSIMDSTKSFYSINPSRFSLQLSLIDTKNTEKLTDRIIEESVVYYTEKPAPFESGKRFDLGYFLEMNGYNRISALVNNTVIYHVKLDSDQGVALDNIRGISILDPVYFDDSISLYENISFEQK